MTGQLSTKLRRRFMSSPLYVFVLLAAFLVLIVYMLYSAPATPVSSGTVTIIAVNDTYHPDGLGASELGGLHRLRTLRKWIERDSPNTILLHAGDFLAPSIISRVFHGAQMIDAMNHLDGDSKAFDDRMYVAFGNHEFDDSKCKNASAPLDARIAESQFTWLVANLDFSNCDSMKAVLRRNNVKGSTVANVGDLKIGIFGIGLTPDNRNAQDYPRYLNEIDVARRVIRDLRTNKVDVIVALTHLDRKDDEILIRELWNDGLDFVVGGHDHEQMVLKDAEGRIRGVKADSDARTAWRIDIRLPKAGRAVFEPRLIALNEAIPRDAAINKLSKSWRKRADEALCAKRAKKRNEPLDKNCMSIEIGRTQTLLELDEIANRSRETGFGDWLADRMIEKTNADVAIVNSGSLRLNYNLAPGSSIRLRHLVGIFQYDDVIVVRNVQARKVCEALRHGFGRSGTGAWPHVAGVVATIPRSDGSTDSSKIAIEFKGRKSNVTCDSAEPIAIATLPFIYCGGDDYPFDGDENAKASVNKNKCIDNLRKNPNAKVPGTKVGEMAQAEISAAGDRGIAPEKDNRIRFR